MNQKPLAVAWLLASVITGSLVSTRTHAAGLSTATALLTLAQQAEAGDRDGRAVELYREAHEANLFDPTALSGLGRLAIRNGSAAEAVAFFQAALAIEQRDRATRHGLADALLEMDEADEALALYEALLAEDAGDVLAWNGKGLALDLAGRHDHAKFAYQAGLALSPDNEEILANLDSSRILAAAPASAMPVLGQGSVTLALNADSGTVDLSSAQTHSVGRDP